MRKMAVVVVLLLLLAGCTDDPGSGGDGGDGSDDQDGGDGPDGSDDGGSDGGASGGGAGNGTGAESNGTNRAPTASVAVNITDDDPLTAVFTIDATDPDGDALEWTLDADGDNETDASGDSVPANATFEYPETGSYNATVRVMDGVDETVVAITVAVEEGAPEPFVGSGTAASPCPQCTEAGANTGVGYRAGESGVDSVFLDIPSAYIGRPFVATASGGDVDLAFRDACSGGGTGGGLVGDPFTGSGDPEGVVPEGTVCVLMWNVDSPNTELTITIS